VRARLSIALAVALAAPGALAAPAAGDSTLVSMGFSSFLPERVEVLEGDSVAWRNASTRTHDIKSDTAGFDSGRVAGGDGFARACVSRSRPLTPGKPMSSSTTSSPPASIRASASEPSPA
jgi:plastocyanin